MTDRRWKRKCPSLSSPDTELILRPKSFIRFEADRFIYYYYYYSLLHYKTAKTYKTVSTAIKTATSRLYTHNNAKLNQTYETYKPVTTLRILLRHPKAAFTLGQHVARQHVACISATCMAYPFVSSNRWQQTGNNFVADNKQQVVGNMLSGAYKRGFKGRDTSAVLTDHQDMSSHVHVDGAVLLSAVSTARVSWP